MGGIEKERERLKIWVFNEMDQVNTVATTRLAKNGILQFTTLKVRRNHEVVKLLLVVNIGASLMGRR